MSTDTTPDADEDTDATNSTTDADTEYYFEDIPEALDELEYFCQIYINAKSGIHAIHDQLETIDRDVGSATATFDGAELTATMSVPTLNGTPDSVIKSHNWENIEIDYDPDTELYSVTLENEFPLFARILEIDYDVPDHTPNNDD